MAFVLNMEALIAPIQGKIPSGENLRYTGVYDQIIEARRADDQLDRGEWQTELKRSDWPLVIKLSCDALMQRSKDLQIAVWLAEALLYEKGFFGLGFGLELISKLMDHFWETLYPLIEDNDFDFRIGPLTYLNEKLPTIVHQVPLTDSKHTKGFGYYCWEMSRQMGGSAGADPKNRRREMVDDGKVSPEAFDSAVKKTPLQFYKDIQAQLNDCRRQLISIDKIITEHIAENPPGFTHLQEAIDECLMIVDKIYSEKKKSEVNEVEEKNSLIKEKDNRNETHFAKQNTSTSSADIMKGNHFSVHNVISDISDCEKQIWKTVTDKVENGQLKEALDQLMASAASAPSQRQKNRYLLLVAKLCINVGRYDLAKPIVEQLYQLIESLNLEKWEHPTWIADVIEALFRCLENENDGQHDRVEELFKKLCTLNITKAAVYRV